ncbi:hypothetical protein [Microcella alkalica]|uniref:hypothetical protein n=1 Tax=Microcella alkalica TaxID=355930 RepID=UPI00145D5DC2|nr:hypothetical protein [Microcella alkalica]
MTELDPARDDASAVGAPAGDPVEAGALRAAMIARALPAIGVGLGITFTADHSSRLGLLALGVLGLASAVALVGGALRLPRGEALRDLHLGLGVVAGLAGAIALVLPGTRLSFLLLILGAWATIAGALELVWGLRHRRGAAGARAGAGHPVARDALIVGAGTLALALVIALISDPVSAVGFLGAYGVVVGVFLVIAALSLPRGTASKEHSPS